MDNTTDKESKFQLFVASMLFFIPIGQPCRKYKNAFKASRSEIKAPSYIQNAGFVCNYLDLFSSGLNKKQRFYYEYNRVDGDNTETIERKITLRPYIFHYNPDKAQKDGADFLVIADSIDIKYSRLNNASIMILTILTVIIGTAQIIISKTATNSPTEYFIDTETFTNMTQTSLITTNMLLILILINVVILTCFVVSHLSGKNKKDEESFESITTY